MNRVVLQVKTGPDGALHLDVPLGPEQAEREVRVVIEPLPQHMTQEEWAAWVASLAGRWQGDFERLPQGDCEQREPLS